LKLFAPPFSLTFFKEIDQLPSDFLPGLPDTTSGKIPAIGWSGDGILALSSEKNPY